ncbi:glycosyltransferase [Polaribacter pectinis]|uniref:Glycosyltransferase n=1 Tax=Polaribacter pectinis TaxID=2738844 RepID=A0A7G9LCA6_9FLAO|nr:glycosyltransferase [Polaribacter pectinis]QNM86255.1 glycosyltransferase [Polaribacter pectinis]
MKVLQITYSSKGGAGIAAKRLHTALQQNGVSSAYLSTNLTIDFKNEIVNDSFFKYKKPTILKRIGLKFLNLFPISKKSQLSKKINQYKKEKGFEIISSPFSSFKLQNHPLFLEADIINLHWVSGILDYTTFFKACKKPIVWTFHDMNPFLGMFHYKNDYNKATIELADFNKKIENIQEQNLNYIKKGAIISPSKWLLEEAIAGGFFTRFIKKNIVNSIDLDTFAIKNKVELRSNYSIKKNEFVILFVAEDVSNYRKGFDLLLDSLSYLNEIQFTILTIGIDKPNNYGKVKVISLGKIYDENKIVEIYNLADVFVLPSREDNLPNVILESFAVGLPIISYNIGGIKEHVLPNKTGFISKELTGVSLSEKIIAFYKAKESFNSLQIRKYAEEHFSFYNQYKGYSKIYKELLKND